MFFCKNNETINHLFFSYSVARVVWACVAKCLGANDIPNDIKHCWLWLDMWLPQGKKVYAWGVAAICWAIWKARNKACFDKKLIKSPVDIICHAGALMKFWTRLFAEMDRATLEEGIDTMVKIAVGLLTSKRSRPSQTSDDQMTGDDDESA
jgi:hypothetical protein